MLFWRGFAFGSSSLGLCSDMSIRIETTDRTIAFAEDLATLFDEWLDVVDKLLLVELFARSAVGFFNELRNVLVACTD